MYYVYLLKSLKNSQITYLAFSDKNKALDFELYLKKGSGNAFAKKRFL